MNTVEQNIFVGKKGYHLLVIETDVGVCELRRE